MNSSSNTTQSPSPKSSRAVIRSIGAQLRSHGFRKVPLVKRVEYSFFDDHENNTGDIGALVLDDAGGVHGLDEGMQIRLSHFKPKALREIESLIDWSRGTAAEREAG